MHGATEPKITTDCPAGDLTGLDRGATLVFKGIRFARAERFADPVDVTSLHSGGTSRPYDATSFRAQAPQVSGVLEAMLGGSRLPTGEDCLNLNVFTPACDDGRRPVLFWVHGGAYTSGGGAMPWYDGSRLAIRGDVVVVTINYRLGALGFLGDRNSGMLDQVSALRWVARNISAFGGDPANVTVFGESAGGSAVIALSALTGSEGLFRRTLAMSPSILQYRNSAEGERNERGYLDAVGVDSVAGLAGLPLEALSEAQAEVLAIPSWRAQHFSPTESTSSIPGCIVDVSAVDPRPMLIGTTRDEANLFNAFDPRRKRWDDADVERHFRKVFDDRAPAAIELYRDARPDADANALVGAMETDFMFRVPSCRLAERRAAAGSATWMYLFDQVTPQFGGVLGSCHALDIPFAFDNLHRPGVESFTGSDPGRQDVADLFAGALLAYARSDRPGWAPYDTESRCTQRIGPEPTVVSDPAPDLRELWEPVEL
jgi:para-nitrobenzyl esterase